MLSAKKSLLSLLLVLILALSLAAEDRLLRFPDVSADDICFVYAGDIWSVPLSGGLARKLTNHEGLELFPKFSPDGKQIAFTGQYDGNTHVYFMPARGGEPTRLTYHPAIAETTERMGPEHVVMDWSRDGSKILYRSRRDVSDVWSGKLYLADVKGGMPYVLPIPVAGFGSLSPDESKIAYCPIYRDFRTWKRYKGGLAQDVYIYDLSTYKQEKITDWMGTDNMPMWTGDKIYFNSDRTGTLNLYCYDLNTKATSQITSYDEYDVRWPSLGPDHIVYENGGNIYLLDLANQESRRVKIVLGSDRILVRPEYVTVDDKVQDYSLAPDGKRALFGARGEVFTVPAEKGNTRNLTNSTAVNEKYSSWSPDGKSVLYVSDRTGEDEIYVIAQDGKGKEIQLTGEHDCWIFRPRWSPDSKLIAFSDANTDLNILDVASGHISVVDEGEKTGIYDYKWSPDSRWLTYTKIPDETNIRVIFLYSLQNNQIYRITDGITHDYSPVFDPEGKYLYFLSDRNFNAALGGYEFNFVYNAMTGIYAILLAEDTPSPFGPESDEVEIGKTKKSGKQAKKNEDEEKKVLPDVKIDLEGIGGRQVAVPIEPGNYNGLKAVEGKIFYFSNPFGGLSGKKGTQEKELRYYDLKNREDKLFLANIDDYRLSFDLQKMLLKSGENYFINDLTVPEGDKTAGGLDLSGMSMYLDRKAEYRQMFEESWRRMRDFFYDPNMHGVDWQVIHDRYAPLVEHVSHRFDLIYLIGEMIGEVCCSHTYVGGGDYFKPESDKVALLGIDFEIDSSAHLYRIGRILKGKNWDEVYRSPLTEPGIEVEEGNYILEVDGQPLTIDQNPYKQFVNKADRIIGLKVCPNSEGKGAREIEVKPIANEEKLRYYNWVEERRAIVDSLSEGKIGYIHIPDMGGFGLNEFAKQFYYLFKKEGLIIDVRFNGGGFVSQVVLDRLRRIIVGMGAGRHEYVGTYPGTAFHGHMACLINEFSCSDGDIFPYYFREYGLGPLIGKRTWGGVVGIGGFRQLTDGGFLTVPGGGAVSLEGEWIMENVGVRPDIEFEQSPDLVMQGRDPQLEKAIEYMLEKIRTEPKTLPPKPGPPEPREE
jgi:tricorn protease